MAEPFKVHVHIGFTYAGAYRFATLSEAEADMAYRERFKVLGFHYRLEKPVFPNPTCRLCHGRGEYHSDLELGPVRCGCVPAES